MSTLIAIGAGIAVLTGMRSRNWYRHCNVQRQQMQSQDSRKQTERSARSLLLGCALAEATAIYGFVIALLIILFLK